MIETKLVIPLTYEIHFNLHRILSQVHSVRNLYTSIYILNFTDTDFHSIDQNILKNIIIVDAQALYALNINQSDGFFQDTLQQLYELFPHENFWMTTLSENNFARPNIISLFKFKILIDFINKHDVEYIFIATKNITSLNIRKYSDIYQSNIIINLFLKAKYLDTVYRITYFYLHSLCTDLICLILPIKYQNISSNYKSLYYTTYKKNFIDNEDKFCSRFVSHNTHVIKYLFTISRNNSRNLKGIRQIISELQELRKNKSLYIIVESFGNLFSFLRSYFNLIGILKWIFYYIRFITTKSVTYSGASIKQFFYFDALSAPFIDIPKNSYLRTCILNLPNHVKTLVLPVFELSEGRSITSGCNRNMISVYGHEHSAGGPAHSWRTKVPIHVISKHKHERNLFLPSKIFCEGNFSASRFSEILPPSNISETIGASRISEISNFHYSASDSSPIVILGEMHNPVSMLVTILSALEFYDKPIIIRPHPATIQKVRNQLKTVLSKRSNVRIDSDTIPLDAFIKRNLPLLFFCGSTGASVDISINGLPVVLIESNNYPNCSPYRFFKFPLVFSKSKDITRFIALYKASSSFRSKYNSRCISNTRKLVSSTGLTAFHKFKSSF